MSISLHTNYSLDIANPTFEGEWTYLLKVAENDKLWRYSLDMLGGDASGLLPQPEGANVVIGYGYDLWQNRSTAIVDLTAAGAIIYDAEQLRDAINSLSGGAPTQEELAQLQLLVYLPDEEAAATLLENAANTRRLLLEQFFVERDVAVFLDSQNKLKESRETAVLLSMWYQSPGGLQSKKNGYFMNATGAITNMVEALKTGNRAEAWYEIRYGSSDGVNGVARRRFAESEVFGLYNSSVVDADEALNVYRMFTVHRDKILLYETRFAAQLAAVDGHYALSGNNEVDSLVESLNPAKERFLIDLAAQYPTLGVINPDDYLSTSIQLDGGRNEGQRVTVFDPNHVARLDGRESDSAGEIALRNILIAEGGDDRLIGGKGDDILIGGLGNDVYYFYDGDGNDRIIEQRETDGKIRGRIVVNDGEEVAIGAFFALGNGWVNGANSITLTHNSPWSLNLAGGGTIDIGEDFVSGDYGIYFLDLPGSDTASTNIINGTTFNDDGTEQGGETRPVLVGDPGDIETADEIHGFLGNDIIDGRAGEDLLFGDDGRDIVFGGLDNDTVQGGTEGDIVSGYFGDDVVIAESLVNGDLRATMDAAIDSDATPPGLTNEWLAGGVGNDILIGGTGNDGLSGGPDIDTLIGGAGNDVIWGDADLVATSLDWYNDGVTFINISGTIPPAGAGAADSIYGGGGDDEIYAEAGDDYVDAGAGDDWVIGHDGSDTIFGGSGDDILDGDSNPGDTAHVIDPSLHGDDYIDGEDGNDVLVGNGGADTLFGGAGNDVLIGDDDTIALAYHGDDYLDGEEGDDELYGFGGNDTLFGGAGADIMHGDEGDDYLDGEDGDDQIAGEAGNDVIFGGAGNDTITGDDGDDSIDGEDGDDLIDGGAGNDYIAGGAGMDQLQGADGDDTLEGGLDADTLFGQAGIDTLSGGDGNDILVGGAGADSLYGDEGNDQLFGDDDDVATLEQGADFIYGGAGDDIIRGYGGDDQLFGEDGSDTIYGEAGADTIEGGAGNDFLWGDRDVGSAEDGNDTLLGGDGNDQLVGWGGDDTLAGGAGTDTLWGGAGNDTYLFDVGDGSDRVFEGDTAGTDVLRFGAGISQSDITFSRVGSDLVATLANGTDQVTINGWYAGAGYQLSTFEFADATTLSGSAAGTLGLQLQSGTSGNDTMGGSALDDSISGLEGNDLIFGNAGNDTIVGGPGNDTLNGGAGNDIYAFTVGDGQDHLQVGVRDDTLRFDASIASSDISYRRVGSDLVFAHVNGTDKVTVDGWYGASSTQLASVVFEADGTTLSNAALSTGGMVIDDQYSYTAGAGALLIEDWGGVDTLSFAAGLAKGDMAPSRVGQDLVVTRTAVPTDKVTIKDWFNDITKQIESVAFAGTGESFSHSELTDPFLTLTGTEGADTLAGGNAYGETMLGLGGNDLITGNGGDDLITGGPGNDTLAGGAGNDRYFFSPGDGQDTIGESVGQGINVVQFAPGMVNNVVFSFPGSDTLITFTGSTDSVRIVNSFFAGVTPKFELNGTNAADAITGSQFGDVIQGLGGNDTINGGDGADEIHGGAGNDILEGGGSETDSAIDRLYGDDGDDILDSGLRTGTGDVGGFLTGGRGNDTLYGSSGADRFLFDLGDGVDTIIDEPLFSNGGWHTSFEDQIIFGAGITQDSLSGSQAGSNLVIRYSPADNITITNWFSNSMYRIDQIVFADGSVMNQGAIQDLAFIQRGTAGDDTLTGSSGNDNLYGLAGNDSLSGLDGDDTLDGGTGNDLLNGGWDNDVYVIRAGDGQDVITDPDGADSIEFGAGLSASGITLGRDGNSLVLSVDGTSDRVTVTDYLKFPEMRIESFVFADASQLPTEAQILDQLVNVRGTAGDDTLTGSSGFDAMFGEDGNDTLGALGDDDQLFGGAGNDTLIGGAGNDQLFGDAGNDVYQYALGDGNDLVSDVSGFDAVAFGAGIAPADVTTARSGSDLVLGINVAGNLGEIMVQNYFAGQETEEIRFSDGTTWDVATVRAMILAASSTSGNDVILGYESDDTINALGGNDEVYGFAGNDVIDGGAGTDTLYGGPGNDTYIVDSTSDQAIENPSEGIDTVSTGLSWTLGANLENLTLTGSSNRTGTGNELDNTIIGNSGRNTLTGGAGNDWLDGGSNRDTLVGGTGDDTYVVDQTGDGITENANEGIDTVQAPVSWTLATNLENLVLTGTANINGTGNAVANVLTGNSGSNTLTGNAGNDTLDGQAGSDTLIGGTGNDTYLLGRGHGAELVQENDATSGNTDIGQFLANIAPEQIWFRQSGSNLEVSVIGTPDKLTIQNWYSGSQYRLEQFRTEDGQTLMEAQVQNLVDAMAAFSPPPPGQTDLPPDYAAQLNPTIAANWQ